MRMSIEAMSEDVGHLLERFQLQITTAESCTGGGLAQSITAVSGSSKWFERGFITYSDQSKEDLLGVSSATIDRYGAVSEEVVKEMAQGAIQVSAANMSIAISGIAGPDGGSEDKPVGLVWIAWGQKLGYAEAECFHFGGTRNHVRAQAVLESLRGVKERLELNT